MIFKKRISIILSVVLCLASASAAIAKGYEYITASSTHRERQTIILDAGHAEQTKPYKTPNSKINVLYISEITFFD